MRKITTIMHTSLDGFVGGPNGEMNWITVGEEMFDLVSKFTDASDSYLLGRKTFEMMEAYWPNAGEQPNASKHDKEHSAWYNNVEKIVVSKTLQGKDIPNATVVSDNLHKAITNIKEAQGKNIVIFGSPSANHALMQHDLIDEYCLFVNPVLLGNGIPMFAHIEKRLALKLVESKTFANGVVFVRYERVKK